MAFVLSSFVPRSSFLCLGRVCFVSVEFSWYIYKTFKRVVESFFLIYHNVFYCVFVIILPSLLFWAASELRVMCLFLLIIPKCFHMLHFLIVRSLANVLFHFFVIISSIFFFGVIHCGGSVLRINVGPLLNLFQIVGFWLSMSAMGPSWLCLCFSWVLATNRHWSSLLCFITVFFDYMCFTLMFYRWGLSSVAI